MPYIKQHQRDDIDSCLLDSVGIECTSSGSLNYAITTICDSYIGSDVSYTRINEAIGALECAKMELYRRIATPYEDKKIQENGDVYRTRV